MKGETEMKADRLKVRRGSIVLGVSMTYLAVREAIALSIILEKFTRVLVSQFPQRSQE